MNRGLFLRADPTSSLQDDFITDEVWVTTTISDIPSGRASTKVTSVSPVTTVQTNSRTSSAIAKAAHSSDGLWTGTKVGLGVCIPIAIFLIIAIASLVFRKWRRSRVRIVSSGIKRVSTGMQRTVPEDSYAPSIARYQKSIGETVRLSIPEVSVIEVRGSLHRLPTVLRPGSMRATSWRYDPDSFSDISPQDTRRSGGSMW